MFSVMSSMDTSRMSPPQPCGEERRGSAGGNGPAARWGVGVACRASGRMTLNGSATGKKQAVVGEEVATQRCWRWRGENQADGFM